MKVAVFPGSFDPFTKAHFDIVKRGLSVFDEIIIAIGVNSAKVGLLSTEERLEAIKAIFKGEKRVSVTSFKGLTVDFCRAKGASFILRGLRNSADLEFESVIAENNAHLNPEVETFFLLSRSSMSHISSTVARDIWRHNGDISHLVPQEVLEVMKKAD